MENTINKAVISGMYDNFFEKIKGINERGKKAAVAKNNPPKNIEIGIGGIAPPQKPIQIPIINVKTSNVRMNMALMKTSADNDNMLKNLFGVALLNGNNSTPGFTVFICTSPPLNIFNSFIISFFQRRNAPPNDKIAATTSGINTLVDALLAHIPIKNQTRVSVSIPLNTKDIFSIGTETNSLPDTSFNTQHPIGRKAKIHTIVNMTSHHGKSNSSLNKK